MGESLAFFEHIERAVNILVYIFCAMYFMFFMPVLRTNVDKATRNLWNMSTLFLCVGAMSVTTWALMHVMMGSDLSNMRLSLCLTVVDCASLGALMFVGEVLCNGKKPRVEFVAGYVMLNSLFVIITALTGSSVMPMISVLFVIAFMVAMLVRQGHFIKKYRKLLCENFSNLADCDTTWYLKFVTLVLCFFVANVVSIYWKSDYVNVCYYVCSLVMIIMLTYYASMQRLDKVEAITDYIAEKKRTGQTGKEPDGGLSDSDIEGLVTKEEEKLFFIRPDVNLLWLSQHCNVSRERLTRFIYEKRGANFYNYVNGLRMKYADLMLKRKDVPEKGIAFACGYISNKDFENHFKLTHGCSFSDYCKRMS